MDNTLPKSSEEVLQNLRDTELDVKIVVCEQDFTIGELMYLNPGNVLVYDTPVKGAAWMNVNGKKFACGSVIQKGEHFAFQIDKLGDPKK